MSCPKARALFVVFGLCAGASGLQAQTVTIDPFTGITHITRTETMPFFCRPGCPPPPSPRLARMHIGLVDLTAPEIHSKLTPITADALGGFVVELRAARLGAGSERVYTPTATATDLAGNTRTSTARCTVPHDQGKR